MPVHDWSRVDAGIFHGFHTLWVTALNNALNDGLLPRDYYAYPGQLVADLLTLRAAVRDTYGDMPAAYAVPAAEPLTLASYRADAPPEAYIEHPAIGQPLSDMPLFFQPQRFINVPLENTYQTAFRGVPSIWREQLS